MEAQIMTNQVIQPAALQDVPKRIATVERKTFLRSAALVFIASMIVTLMFWYVLPSSMLVNENSDYKAFYGPVARNLLRGAVTL